jgi:hypothetical protein
MNSQDTSQTGPEMERICQELTCQFSTSQAAMPCRMTSETNAADLNVCAAGRPTLEKSFRSRFHVRSEIRFLGRHCAALVFLSSLEKETIDVRNRPSPGTPWSDLMTRLGCGTSQRGGDDQASPSTEFPPPHLMRTTHLSSVRQHQHKKHKTNRTEGDSRGLMIENAGPLHQQDPRWPVRQPRRVAPYANKR